ncbi:threonine/homoserine/homoserine lactone efflux protein [Pseudomonas sp. BIGb0408]|uniref:Threonine/homoserine/homoserine lactone efflux protein n=1 Tax=Phytopseudomonas flavescens TaxID=29435 RepID=A0A7Z0BNE3_9GAMM|nr:MULTISPECIES: LysE family translocator [Pseudomonas]MCW2293636.1 threonine/homoserine/homoserine lactone efflux protein [Pseudomonas sp. BIGb0408]NYH71794.1 threonine/homoserine/homoserine lactone efflux protein [Pseudomonas flavescens]
MQQFLIIAAAHFLALLSPGPDFFLVARTSLSAGWRVASGACLGIALANAVFIVAAFTGVSALQPGSAAFIVLQLVGCLYLLYLGVLFIRHAGSSVLQAAQGTAAARPINWMQAAGMGFLSGILNPKNALFYVSLASMLGNAHGSAGWKLFYGAWMFAVVLGWDLLVALAIGNGRVLQRFQRALPLLERLSGLVLIALALGMLGLLLIG